MFIIFDWIQFYIAIYATKKKYFNYYYHKKGLVINKLYIFSC